MQWSLPQQLDQCVTLVISLVVAGTCQAHHHNSSLDLGVQALLFVPIVVCRRLYCASLNRHSVYFQVQNCRTVSSKSSLLLLLCREAFLPGSKAGVHSSQTEAAYGPDSIGKYDPILHKWIIEPDQQKWQAREREHANEVVVSARSPCLPYHM